MLQEERPADRGLPNANSRAPSSIWIWTGVSTSSPPLPGSIEERMTRRYVPEEGSDHWWKRFIREARLATFSVDGERRPVGSGQ